MYRILTINPGSTSTKVSVFEDDKEVFNKNVAHKKEELDRFDSLSEQKDYRKQVIIESLKENNTDLDCFDAVVGRGGGLLAMEGGVYGVNEIMLEHARIGANGVQHPANLGSLLAHDFAEEFKCHAYVVNPPDTDELQAVARLTGVKGVYRNVHLHALNLKETALHHCRKYGIRYEDKNFIVCHLGGGISISAHQKGKMIDGNDIVGGEGPMTPTRCGSVPVLEVSNYLKDHDSKELKKLCQKNGGFLSLLGTNDALEVSEKASAGDKKAKLAWDTMAYQIEKWIGAMSAVLKGDVDGILISGGIAYNKDLIDEIERSCGYIAQVFNYPGEFEMNAMASGAIRVLDHQETVKEYTGIKCWSEKELI